MPSMSTSAYKPRPNRAQRRAGNRGQRTGNARRGRQQQLPSVYDPTQQLAGRSLKQAAGALTDLEINPQLRQLSRQIANINRQGTAVQDRTAGYFQDLGAQAQQALTNQQGISSRLNTTLQGIGDQTQGQIGAAGQQAQQSLAPLQATGLGGGGFEQLVREIAAQQSNAAQNSQTARNFGAQQGGNFEGLTAAQMGTGTLRGEERLSELGNAFALQAAEPRAKKAELIGSRGALMTKNLGALRDSERNYGLAVQTLGLDATKAAADTATDRARIRQGNRQFKIETALKDRDFQLDYSKYGLDVARDNYQRAHGLGPYRPASGSSRPKLTQTQRHAAFEDIDAATRVATDMIAQGNGTGFVRTALAKGYYEVPVTDASGNQLYDTSGAAKTRRVSIPRVGDRTLVNAAMDLAVKGQLSRPNVKALHGYGLQIGGRYRYARKGGGRRTGRAISQGGAGYRGF